MQTAEPIKLLNNISGRTYETSIFIIEAHSYYKIKLFLLIIEDQYICFDNIEEFKAKYKEYVLRKYEPDCQYFYDYSEMCKYIGARESSRAGISIHQTADQITSELQHWKAQQSAESSTSTESSSDSHANSHTEDEEDYEYALSVHRKKKNCASPDLLESPRSDPLSNELIQENAIENIASLKTEPDDSGPESETVLYEIPIKREHHDTYDSDAETIIDINCEPNLTGSNNIHNNSNANDELNHSIDLMDWEEYDLCQESEKYVDFVDFDEIYWRNYYRSNNNEKDDNTREKDT